MTLAQTSFRVSVKRTLPKTNHFHTKLRNINSNGKAAMTYFPISRRLCMICFKNHCMYMYILMKMGDSTLFAFFAHTIFTHNDTNTTSTRTIGFWG